jgi:sterol 3beta-glucosyltransferase
MMTEVAHSTGKRLLISKGWGAIGSGMQPDNCLFVDEVPFDLLFPHVAMVIHHGGIGTLAAAAKAGVPQAAFPFMADQFMNRKELVRLGLSPQTTSFGKLSAKILTRVIEEGLAGTGYCERASEIAREINECDGTDMTVKLIEGLLKDKKR